MSYAEWVAKPWTLTRATPGTGSTRFGLSAPGTLRFDGTGTLGSNSNVYLNGSKTPWGESCVFSSTGVVETVTGTHKATGQPFTITRTVGEKIQHGEVLHPPPSPPRRGLPHSDDHGHGAGSGCGVWTANDG